MQEIHVILRKTGEKEPHMQFVTEVTDEQLQRLTDRIREAVDDVRGELEIY